MKLAQTTLTMILLAAGLCVQAAQESPSTNATAVVVQAATNQPAADTVEPGPAAPATPAENGDTNGLRMNFRGAPLNLVLDYLSDAAGFIINKEADVKGTVEVWSKDPLTKEEAVQLLNSVLKKNGYAVIRNGRILTIVSLDTAKTADLDIVSGTDPEEVEKSDEVVTQIVPVRYANATQLMNNLQVLLPTSASLSANESANTLIIVATKTDIRRMLKIVHALDTSIASVSNLKVFPLRFADAKQLATVIQQLFAPQATQGPGGMNRGQFFAMMRGGGAGGAAAAGGPGTGANAAATKVVAAADEYSNSLIVGASAELLTTITDVVNQIDQPVSDVTELRVFRLLNADPSEIADQLAQLFPDDSRNGNSGQGGNNNNRFRFFGARGGQQSTSSDRSSKKSRVLAVPDARTSSIIVSAAGELMPQIAEMIAQLDMSPARKEKVVVYDLQNADPQDVQQVLQDLFNRNNTMRANNNNRGSLLGQNNPLTQRATQQQNNSSTMTSRFGNNSRTGTGGTGY